MEMIPDDFYFLGNDSRWLLLSMSFFIDVICFWSRPGVFLQETVKPLTGFMRSIRSRRFPKKPKAIFGNNSRWLLLSMSFFIDVICFWSWPGVFLQETVKPFTGFMRSIRSRRFPKKSKAIFSEIIPDGFYFQSLFSSISFASGHGRGILAGNPKTFYRLYAKHSKPAVSEKV